MQRLHYWSDKYAIHMLVVSSNAEVHAFKSPFKMLAAASACAEPPRLQQAEGWRVGTVSMPSPPTFLRRDAPHTDMGMVEEDSHTRAKLAMRLRTPPARKVREHTRQLACSNDGPPGMTPTPVEVEVEGTWNAPLHREKRRACRAS